MMKHTELKKTVEIFFKKNKKIGRKAIFDHFIQHGVPQRTLHFWLNKLERGGTLERQKGSGRPIKIATKSNIATIKRMFNHRSGRSQKVAAAKFNTSQPYISTILKKYTNIKCRKKIKKPLMTELQKKAARPKCRHLLAKYFDVDFILDDESYFTLSNTSLAGNDRFYSDNVYLTPHSVKNKYKAKNEAKLLVYVVIAQRGMSKVKFFESGMGIKGLVYRDQMLKNVLVPFVRKYYRDDRYVFWPDLAPAYYSNVALQYLKDENISYVPRALNPANVPKARPIEDFWGLLKAIVYKNNWSARTLKQLQKRITWAITKIDPTTFRNTCTSIHQRLNIIAKYGVDAL